MNRSPGPIFSLAGKHTATTSTSAQVVVTRSLSRSPSRVRGRCRPGVSTSTSWASGRCTMPRTTVRVVCGRDEVIATLVPTSALVRVDLPALGRPTKDAKPLRNSGTRGLCHSPASGPAPPSKGCSPPGARLRGWSGPAWRRGRRVVPPSACRSSRPCRSAAVRCRPARRCWPPPGEGAPALGRGLCRLVPGRSAWALGRLGRLDRLVGRGLRAWAERVGARRCRRGAPATRNPLGTPTARSVRVGGVGGAGHSRPRRQRGRSDDPDARARSAPGRLSLPAGAAGLHRPARRPGRAWPASSASTRGPRRPVAGRAALVDRRVADRAREVERQVVLGEVRHRPLQGCGQLVGDGGGAGETQTRDRDGSRAPVTRRRTRTGRDAPSRRRAGPDRRGSAGQEHGQVGTGSEAPPRRRGRGRRRGAPAGRRPGRRGTRLRRRPSRSTTDEVLTGPPPRGPPCCGASSSPRRWQLLDGAGGLAEDLGRLLDGQVAEDPQHDHASAGPRRGARASGSRCSPSLPASAACSAELLRRSSRSGS